MGCYRCHRLTRSRSKHSGLSGENRRQETARQRSKLSSTSPTEAPSRVRLCCSSEPLSMLQSERTRCHHHDLSDHPCRYRFTSEAAEEVLAALRLRDRRADPYGLSF